MNGRGGDKPRPYEHQNAILNLTKPKFCLRRPIVSLKAHLTFGAIALS